MRSWRLGGAIRFRRCARKRTGERVRGRRAARLLYLPAYSPDYNPSELAFSKLKRLLRQAAERTAEGLWAALGRLLEHFSAEECRNYFRHCGYPATPS
jgi:transposase